MTFVTSGPVSARISLIPQTPGSMPLIRTFPAPSVVRFTIAPPGSPQGVALLREIGFCVFPFIEAHGGLPD